MDIHIAWYILIGVLLIGYAILDGFDLGVGALHLFTRKDHDRRILMNAIGPVWDGNEVWLITFGGALFAAFPEVYATGFSTFYLPFMLLIMALIFRAVALEFRSKEEGKRWRNFWDGMFALGSMLAAGIFGIAIGTVVMGLQIGADKEFAGSIGELFQPYALLIGLFTIVMFAMHGGMYLLIKTEGALQAQIKKLSFRFFLLFLGLYAVVTVVTIWMKPEMLANFSFGQIALSGKQHRWITEHTSLISVVAWTLVGLNILAIINIPRCIKQGKYMQGFLSSAANLAALITLFAMGIFPNLIISSMDPAFNLDIYNSASSTYTLSTMFKMALIGMPFVLFYTGLIYWSYRGKTVLGENSY